MGFTFKNDKEKGRAGFGAEERVILKIKRMEVGTISGHGWFSKDNYFRIRLQVVNNDHNNAVKWSWITLNPKKESMAEAKEWVNENYDKIRQKYDIYIEK